MSLDKTIKGIKTSFSKELSKSKTSSDLEKFRIKYLGRNGQLASLFEEFNKLPAAEKPRYGKELNVLKNDLTRLYKEAAGDNDNTDSVSDIDFTLPGYDLPSGHIHPLEQITSEIKSIFQSIGFSVAYGPEIDDDYHNFEALNVPEDHPAKDMHDTFYLNNSGLLRTHTSPVQIRTMEKSEAPHRIICPGKVYRKDSDLTHTPMFHQIEGLVVEEDASFSQLKGLLNDFLEDFFGEEVELRFRPSYFPFTEPSAEADIRWNKNWLEVLGCGMVHPNVLEGVGVDTNKYTGFAFGLGVERMAMLKYDIPDLRAFFENDIRFLDQF